MITSEQLLSRIYGGPNALPANAGLHTAAQWLTYALAIAGVLGGGWLATRRARAAKTLTQ